MNQLQQMIQEYNWMKTRVTEARRRVIAYQKVVAEISQIVSGDEVVARIIGGTSELKAQLAERSTRNLIEDVQILKHQVVERQEASTELTEDLLSILEGNKQMLTRLEAENAVLRKALGLILGLNTTKV